MTKTSADPSKLVGVWTRTITLADMKRTGGYGNTPGTVCTVTIKKSGAIHLVCRPVGAWDGNIVPVGRDRIHLNVGDITPNMYRWRLSGSLLTVTKLYDSVPERAAAWWGVWKRK